MSRFVGYYSRFTGVRNDLKGLPPWARTILFIIVTPGIVLVALSIVLFLVSVAALLLLAVPAYALLQSITGGMPSGDGAEVYDPDPNRIHGKRVDVKVIDPGNQVPDEVNGE